MSKRVDLTGKRFGALTALRFVPANESPTHVSGWMVRCDCGKERFVDGKNLRRGNYTSCGCGLNRIVDLTGQRFGALTVLKYVAAADNPTHYAGWMVRCDCGTEKFANGDALRSGKITSCGCNIIRNQRRAATIRESPKYEDITGQKFYRLTALEFLGRNYWRWRCDCGNETTAKAADVKSGEIQSCGCLLSETGHKKAVEDNVFEYFDGTIVSRLRHIMADPVTKGIKPRTTSGGIMTWAAYIGVQGKEISLGTFATREAAEQARRYAERRYWLPIIRDYEYQRKCREEQKQAQERCDEE